MPQIPAKIPNFSKQIKQYKLDILKANFTQKDLEFVRGKIVRPVVGAPWIKTTKGCAQTKTATVEGVYTIRIRAIRTQPSRSLYDPPKVHYLAEWALVSAPREYRHFQLFRADFTW